MGDDVETRVHQARCSFCRKGSAEVKALIAGPGVYICNECVDLTAGIVNKLGQVEQKTPFNVAEHFRGFDNERLLSLVGKIEPVYQDVAGQQALMIDILRERQVSWAEIGETLGVTRQAAWRRFAKGPEGA